jgi:YD repeat-containing protein
MTPRSRWANPFRPAAESINCILRRASVIHAERGDFTLISVKYSNKSTGAASTNASDQNSFTYDALGEMKAKVDQNGTTYTYGRDILGRMTSGAVTLATSNPKRAAVAPTYNSKMVRSKRMLAL